MIEEHETTPRAGAADGDGPRESASHAAMSAAREELALISAQLNDGHTRLIALMRQVLTDELWCGGGFRSPEQWLTAYAGLTWSSAHDIVRIATRCPDLPTMQRLLEEGRLTLGLAAVIAKYTPADYDTDVAEFASYTTVTQLRRALCRYDFTTTTNNSDQGTDTDSQHDDDGTDDDGGQDTDTWSHDGGQDTGTVSNDDSPSDTGESTDDEPTAFLPGDASTDADRIDDATDAAQRRAPGPFDPATAPPRLQMRYTAGRFHLTYDAPADIGALVEQALLEAKDTLFHLRTRTMTNPHPATSAAAAATAGSGSTTTSPFSSASSTTPPGTPTSSATTAPGTSASATAAARPDLTDCGHTPADSGPAAPGRGASFGDALGLLAQRSLDTGAPLGHSRASRYRIYLHLDTNGHGWLHKHPALPPALRERILCDGIIQPIWETEGTPVNVGRAQRIVPARTRRLLEDRDRGCRFPGCLTTHHLECHHLDHWTHGGHTNADRMIMLCPHHHDEHHRGTYVIVGDPTRPDGITFTTRNGTRLRPDYRTYPPPHNNNHGSSSSDSGDSSSSESTHDTDTRTGIRAGVGTGTRNTTRTAPTHTPYPGPTNETLHLSLVRFHQNPPPTEPDDADIPDE